jgi:LmbE family N-acetylglucosaminyl deacetylase
MSSTMTGATSDVESAARTPASLFVSPHLDDAVFSCGESVASSRGSAVVTVFAGRPPPACSLTAWDAACGFTAGEDVIGLRRSEDRLALEMLGARAIWLDFCDDQYGEARTTRAIGDALAEWIARESVATVHIPLGLFHSDHKRASDAALPLIRRFATLQWYVYEDVIYRCIEACVEQRVRLLQDSGFVLERQARAFDVSAHARKREAVACYRSQLRGLRTRRHHDDIFAPERLWSIASRRGGAA